MENALAIICACLPTYGPFLHSAKTGSVNLEAWVFDMLRRFHSKPKDISSSTRIGLDQPGMDLAQGNSGYIHLEDGRSTGNVQSHAC